MKIFVRVILLGSFFLLSACGTTSGFQKPTTEKNASQNFEKRLSIANYDRLVIGNFIAADGVEDASQKTNSSKHVTAEQVNQMFRKALEKEIAEANLFSEIIMQSENEVTDALLLNGQLLRFQEGDAAARMLLGLGAGMSHFDAKVVLSDAASGEVIGEFIIDKNSWALGGFIAWKQDLNAHMRSAATKITKELKMNK